MGSRVAQRLLSTGHAVVAWNRSAEKLRPLIDHGARAAGSPAEAASRADAVLTIVADALALRAVTEGPEGVLAGIAPGTTIIEMSTVGPAAIGRLAEKVPSGIGLVDAPVLGSVEAAEAGTLTILVGGSDALVARWTPLLSTLGTPLHTGALGSGAAAKLVANATLFASIALLGEAVALGDGLELSRDVTFAVLGRTPLAAQVERRRQTLEKGQYSPRFSLALARKDADLIADAARRASVDSRLIAATRSWIAECADSGWGDRDYTAILARIVGSATGRSPLGP
jgi:3-hydroxyisobutyrate dehydrogenase-like beta-hydroxyacid dehydrogenase